MLYSIVAMTISAISVYWWRKHCRLRGTQITEHPCIGDMHLQKNSVLVLIGMFTVLGLKPTTLLCKLQEYVLAENMSYHWQGESSQLTVQPFGQSTTFCNHQHFAVLWELHLAVDKHYQGQASHIEEASILTFGHLPLGSDTIDFLSSCYHGHLTSLKPLSSYKLAQTGEIVKHPDISIVSNSLLRATLSL